MVGSGSGMVYTVVFFWLLCSFLCSIFVIVGSQTTVLAHFHNAVTGTYTSIYRVVFSHFLFIRRKEPIILQGGEWDGSILHVRFPILIWTFFFSISVSLVCCKDDEGRVDGRILKRQHVAYSRSACSGKENRAPCRFF